MQQQDPNDDLFEPLKFLKHCRDVVAGGMHGGTRVLDAARGKSLRDFEAEHSLCIGLLLGNSAKKFSPSATLAS